MATLRGGLRGPPVRHATLETRALTRGSVMRNALEASRGNLRPNLRRIRVGFTSGSRRIASEARRIH
eukprot:6479952-Pyramimonas_sp.AAC.1